VPHSHLVVYQRNVPPIDRTMVRCAVCGQWNDADKTQQPEECQTSYVTTGTVYFAKKPGGEIDLQAINKTVEGVCPPFLGCFFCGTPRLYDGAAGPLKK
jgi:hypothetical protein